MLVHPKSDAPLCIMVDASDVAIGDIFQQHVEGKWEPISFFSKRLQPAETKCSTFSRELLAVYLAIRNFRHALEGWQFCVYTDHRLLAHAFQANLIAIHQERSDTLTMFLNSPLIYVT